MTPKKVFYIIGERRRFRRVIDPVNPADWRRVCIEAIKQRESSLNETERSGQ
jgi:hypothetical protein